MVEHVDWLVLWILVPLGLFYLGVPLWIRARQRLAAHPAVRELELEALDPEIAAFLMGKTRELFALGFDEPALLELPAPVPNITVYLVLLVNRATGDKAVVMALVGSAAVAIQSLYVEFSTRFDDDQLFATLNSEELSALPPSPATVRTQVPGVQDVRELYELHRYVILRRDVVARPQLFPPGGAIDYLVRFAFEKEYERAVRRGWLYYVASGDYYLPTLVGAYLMTWGLLQPAKFFRTVALRQRERRLLAEFRRHQDSV